MLKFSFHSTKQPERDEIEIFISYLDKQDQD